MRELARGGVRFGHRTLHVPLGREGWTLGRDQADRLYTEKGLQVRSRLPEWHKSELSGRLLDL